MERGDRAVAEGIVTSDDGPFTDMVSGSPPEIRELALDARQLIFAVLPQTVEVVWPHQRTAGYGTGPKKMTEHFCWLAPFSRHLVLGLLLRLGITRSDRAAGGNRSVDATRQTPRPRRAARSCTASADRAGDDPPGAPAQRSLVVTVGAVSYGLRDRQDRQISLRAIGEDWRDVADVAPRDDQRQFVPALAARYLLLTEREGVWRSLGIYADELVVGHVMWGEDDDGSVWIGGLVVDASAQGLWHRPGGYPNVDPLVLRRARLPGDPPLLPSGESRRGAAVRKLGFHADRKVEDDEIVAELRSAP